MQNTEMSFGFKSNCKKTEVISEGKNAAMLQKQHARNRSDFLQRSHTMQFDQIFIEHLLLKMEEQIFFEEDNDEFRDWDAEKEAELEFLRSRNCCNLKFQSFTEWEVHILSHHTSMASSQHLSKEKGTISKENAEKDTMSIASEESYESLASTSGNKAKVYKCNRENCNKFYTSAYGLRYHLEKGHKEDDSVAKPFQCIFEGCKKRYKNANGLKYHLSHGHN